MSLQLCPGASGCWKNLKLDRRELGMEPSGEAKKLHIQEFLFLTDIVGAWRMRMTSSWGVGQGWSLVLQGPPLRTGCTHSGLVRLAPLRIFLLTRVCSCRSWHQLPRAAARGEVHQQDQHELRVQHWGGEYCKLNYKCFHYLTKNQLLIINNSDLKFNWNVTLRDLKLEVLRSPQTSLN